MKNSIYMSPKEMTDVLNIGDSTLRKWCIALEEQEYFFSRTDNNRRVFSDRDRVVLKKFRDLVQVQNLSMQNAAIIVASRYKGDAFEQENIENAVTGIRSGETDIDGITKEVEQLKHLNIELIKRLEERDKYIEERLEKRDSYLLQEIKELKKINQLLLESGEKENKTDQIEKMIEQESNSQQELLQELISRMERMEEEKKSSPEESKQSFWKRLFK